MTYSSACKSAAYAAPALAGSTVVTQGTMSSAVLALSAGGGAGRRAR